jgi:hypothetical protein
METQARSSRMKAKKLNAKMMERGVENLRDDLDHARFEVGETRELIDAVQGVCDDNESSRVPRAVLDMIKGKLLVAMETYT